jgi:hypothetical protein
MLLALLLAACGLQPPAPPPSLLSPWSYADLRLLDPADADLPSHDLAAVYLRRSGDDLQLRLDLLAGVDRLDYDLYLALQAAPGGTNGLPIQSLSDLAWDTLLVIPAAGPLQALTPSGSPRTGAALSVFRHPADDAVLVSLHLPALFPTSFTTAASRLQLQVFLTPAGSAQLADQTSILRSDGPPPTPANLLLAFWDVYPAYTPATALRRWDGAHTGPLGGRHGLYNLLRTAQAAGVPLVLLDLKDPASLSALDYAGGLDLVRQMALSGLLILPDPLLDPHYGPFGLSAPDQAALLETSQAISARFGLPPGQFLYLPQSVPPPQAGRGTLFARLPFPDNPASASPPGSTGTPSSPGAPSSTGDPLTLLRWQDRTVIPLPAQSALDDLTSPSPQLDLDGITLDWRRRLLSAAIYAGQPGSSPENTFLCLGGDLPASAWGDPQSARAAFRWLVAHPWVRFLDAAALLGARPTQPAPFVDTAAEPSRSPMKLAGEALAPTPPTALLAAMQGAPANPLSQAAWQVYRSLYAPLYPDPPQLRFLRRSYAGQIWSLLQAAGWAASSGAAAPGPLATCDLDPDHDGQPECLLASDRFYAQFEIADGSLTYLFAAYPPGDLPAGWPDAVHQLVGPSSQFIAGLSSPDTWQLDPAKPGPTLASTLSADPSVIPGAFAGPGSGFLPSLDRGDLLFTSPGGQAVKTFHLDHTGLQVSYRLSSGASYPPAQIPLVLDPWRRFIPGWAGLYRSETSAGAWSWQIQSGPQLVIRASTSLLGGDFSQSRPLFSAAEDPNRDFPLAHFTPFPLALLQVPLTDTAQISIQLLPQP